MSVGGVSSATTVSALPSAIASPATSVFVLALSYAASAVFPASIASENHPPTVLIIEPIASPIALNGAIILSITGQSQSINLLIVPFMPSHIETNKSEIHVQAAEKAPVTACQTPVNQLATFDTTPAMPSHIPLKKVETEFQIFLKNDTALSHTVVKALTTDDHIPLKKVETEFQMFLKNITADSHAVLKALTIPDHTPLNQFISGSNALDMLFPKEEKKALSQTMALVTAVVILSQFFTTKTIIAIKAATAAITPIIIKPIGFAAAAALKAHCAAVATPVATACIPCAAATNSVLFRIASMVFPKPFCSNMAPFITPLHIAVAIFASLVTKASEAVAAVFF